MPSNFVPQQLPVSGMEMGNVGSSTPDIQMGGIGSVSSCPGSQQFLISNNQMGMMPNYTGSQDLSTTYMHMGHIANGNGSQFGEMPTDLGSYQLAPMKRKAPVEPMFFSPGSHQLMSNKRMAQLEHRPWLQQAPAANKRTVQLESTASAPGSQNLSAPSKKMVKMDSFSGRSGPISKNSKNQTSQMQPSPKAQNESFESVRSKMRETLAAALALVNQQQYKFLESGNKSPEKSQEAPGPAEDPKENLPSSETSSTPKNNIPESAGQSIMSNANTSGSTLSSICDGKDFRASNILPYDVSFGDNLFVKDELLQGNGLSWVLESDIEMVDRKEFMPAVKEELDHEMGIPPKEQEVSPPEVAFRTPEQLASEIEAELFKLFGGVNKKYKEKGRSLLFNLKDRNNPELRERVMSGEITPARLCSMTAEELASKELSEWRMAKAEELAQMVVLPDSELDMRRLVKKTHKGEVEVEQFDNASMEVPISLDRGQSRSKESEVSAPLKSVKRKIEVKARSKNNDVEESFTFPSNDGTDLLHGLMVDDGLKDLPPIVSLDEFMESLDNEPPFEIPPEDVTPVSNKEESGTGSESKSSASSPKNSMQASPQKHEVDATKPEDVVKSEDSPAANRTEDDPTVIKMVDGPAVIGTDDGSAVSKSVASADLKSTDTSTEVKSINGLEKAESKPVEAHKGEHIWGGSLQLSISTKASVVGIFKSGEKTSAKVWPDSLEIKGRVRLDAFEKFLQELPQSRSRAVMVVHFVSKDGSSESDCSTLREVRDSYTSDGRVGFSEPCSGVELYLCPPHNKTCDMLSKIIQKEHVEALNSIDNGLIGVVVWRKLSSPKSSSHQKHVSKKHHYSSSSSSSSRRQHESNSTANYTSKPSQPRVVPPTNTKVTTHDDEEDEVPPGFGPPASRDDDDLPEFNYSGTNSSVQQLSTQRPAVDKMRELILKYGQNNNRVSWNDHDDDDDIPEWQPDAPPSQYQPAVSNYQQPVMRPHMASATLQQQPMQPQINVALGIQTPNLYWQQGNQWTPPPPPHPPLPQSGGVWASNVALQPESGQFYGEPDRGTLAWRQNAPRSRGF